MITPPAPCTGSPMNAAILSAPIGSPGRAGHPKDETEFIAAHRPAMLEPERLLDVDDARDRQAALRMHAAHAAERCTSQRRAVIRVVAAHDDRALGLAHHVPIAAHQANDGVVALGARVGEEHVLELRRRDVGEQFGKLDCRRRRGLKERVVEGQLLQLRGRRIDQLLSPVADVDAPQARHRIEDLVTVAVPQVDVVGARDDARTLGRERLEIGERVQVVRRVGVLPLLGRTVNAHTCSSRCSRSHGEMTFMNSSYSISFTSE